MIRVVRFSNVRPDHVRGHFMSFFILARTAEPTLQAEGGRVLVKYVPVPLGQASPAEVALVMFTGVPIKLSAVADPGREFSGWSDGAAAAERIVTLTADQSLTAPFD